MSDQLNLDLDPKKVLKGLQDMSAEAKKLADVLEKTLGKQAPEAIHKTEEAAEKGSAKISASFRNLGQSVREGLKTAFNVGSIMQGLNIGKALGQGTAQVFEMEKAFDRLNTRLGLSGKQLTEFRNAVGRAAAGAGRGVEEILPGVEVMAAKGGVEGPQLGMIADTLAKAATASGDESGALADTVIEILKTQGREVNASNVKGMIDALQGARVAGAFHTATEAGMDVMKITQKLQKDEVKKMGFGDEEGARKLSGLVAMASRGGEQGTQILEHILSQASEAGGKDRLNAVFGTDLFDQSGKLDVNKFGSIDKEKYGAYSAQTLGAATGADKAALDRFIDAMKQNTATYEKVLNGTEENTRQYKTSSDNLSTTWDKLWEGTKEGARELGAGLSGATNAAMKGDLGRAKEAFMEGMAGAEEYKGSLAAGVAAGGASATATGMGLNALAAKFGLGAATGGTSAGIAGPAAGLVAPVALGALGAAGAGGVMGGGTEYAKENPYSTIAGSMMHGNQEATMKAFEVLFDRYFGDKKAVQYTNPSDVSGNRGGGQ